VVETGRIGTDSSHAKIRKVKGIVVPAPVNAHTHLADAVWGREPPHEPVERIVGTPQGLKFRILSETPPSVKSAAIREAMRQMARDGVGAVIDFREEGVAGADLLRRASRGSATRTVILGRPLRRPLDPAEMDRLLTVADGVGLSSVAEEPPDVRDSIARRCRSEGKWYALHASEVRRESPNDYLRPRPDLLVHLTYATPADLEQVRAEGVYVAVCPRSNALFGRRPDLAAFQEAEVHLMLGTDNAMFQAPSIWREVEFAYHTARLASRPVSPEFLFRCAFVRPWTWLRAPEAAWIDPAGNARPVVLRLPTDDPYYQVVARATEHVMVRPPSRTGRGAP
jgi:cytosine/adenosine deaminase-related metal-dependent hydrolase